MANGAGRRRIGPSPRRCGAARNLAIPVHHALKNEIHRAYALETGAVGIYRQLERHARHRKVAALTATLEDVALAHLDALELACHNEGWRIDPFAVYSTEEVGPPLQFVHDWLMVAEESIAAAASTPEGDAASLALLTRIAYLLLPCYEFGAVLAEHSERTGTVRALRLAAGDERECAAKVLDLVESGVSGWADFGAAPFSSF